MVQKFPKLHFKVWLQDSYCLISSLARQTNDRIDITERQKNGQIDRMWHTIIGSRIRQKTLSTYFMLVKLTFDLFDVVSDWLLLLYDFLRLQEPCKDIFKVILVGRKVNRGRAGHTVLTGGAADWHDDLETKLTHY